MLEHRIALTELSMEEAREQLWGSRGGRQVTGKPCRTICFLGADTAGAVELVREAGYLFGAHHRAALLLSFHAVSRSRTHFHHVQAYPIRSLYTKNALKRRSLGNLMRSAGALFYRRTWLRLARKLLERTHPQPRWRFSPLGTLLGD